MHRVRAITISGEVSSGKSSITDALLDLLPHWRKINTGQTFRDFLESKGESIQRVSFLPNHIHREFDEIQKTLLEREVNIIVEGRLAGWLARDLKDVFKVFCYAPLEVRIERYMRREKCSMAKAVDDIGYRDRRDIEKFRLIYGVPDYRLPEFYDLQLDTSSSLPLELGATILAKADLIAQSN